MDDVTVTQLFAKMDAHLDRQDVELRLLSQTLQQQYAVLAQMAQVLATTAQQQTQAFTEITRVLTGLTTVLDAHLRAPRPDSDGPPAGGDAARAEDH